MQRHSDMFPATVCTVPYSGSGVVMVLLGQLPISLGGTCKLTCMSCCAVARHTKRQHSLCYDSMLILHLTVITSPGSW